MHAYKYLSDKDFKICLGLVNPVQHRWRFMLDNCDSFTYHFSKQV
jgi:hypothetical protein